MPEPPQPLTGAPSNAGVQAGSHPKKRWLARIEPGGRENRALTALTAGMSSLVLRNQAIALEIAAHATPIGVRRTFLLRTQTLEGRTHLCAQLQARYPQARIVMLETEDDPLLLSSYEAVTCVTMHFGAPVYLPLKTWERVSREEEMEGNDPLLSLLAALSTLPPKHRAVVQLALAPASPTWSRQAQRLAQEHPLEEERFQRQLLARARMRSSNTIAHELFLECLGLLLLLLLVGNWLWAPLHTIVPPWVSLAGATLLQGQLPHLSAWEGVQLVIGLLLILGLLSGIGILYAKFKKRFFGGRSTRRIYDPELVRQKTARIAYRAQLRLYVIGPCPHAAASFSRTQQDRRGSRWRALRDPFRWNQTRGMLRVMHTRAWWTVLPTRGICLLRRGKQWTGTRILLAQRRHRMAQRQREVIHRLVAALSVYHLAAGNFFVPRRSRSWFASRRLAPAAASTRLLGRPLWWKLVLTPEEVASLYHLVQDADLRNLSLVDRHTAQTRPVPAVLASASRGEEPIGINVHAGKRTPVYFPSDGFSANLLALAGTGKGKSSLFAHLARILFADSPTCSVILVDPHGDLSLAFLGCVPQARQDDVIYLNLADTANPPALNFVDLSAGQDPYKMTDILVRIFRTWWGGDAANLKWGPMLENTLQYSLLSICKANQAICRVDPHDGPRRQYSILSIVPLLQQSVYRDRLLETFQDYDIWSWWDEYYLKRADEDQQQSAASVISRLSKFRASRGIRRVLGQPVSSISLADVITHRRLLIMNTAGGVVGEDTSSLCGSMVLGLLQAAIAEQAERAAANRVPVYVFLDEMQKYTGVDLQAMLAELRKFGGHFALATQSLKYLDALSATLRPTLLANVDHLFAFDTSAEDAASMAAEIGEGMEAEDILSLANYACYAKLSHRGRRFPVFSLELLPPPTGDPALVTTLQTISVQRYGTPARVADRLIRRQEPRPDPKTQRRTRASTHAPDEDDEAQAPDAQTEM